MNVRSTAYPRWLRWWHWGNVALFVTSLVTGLQMHYSPAAIAESGYRTAVLLHNTAGILLTAGYAIFLLGNLFLGNGRYYLLAAGDLSWGLLLQARHYLLGIFAGDPQPFPHTETRKFNPLQKLSYLAVMYLLYPVLVATGWALLFPELLPRRMLGVPGIGVWAVAHVAVACFLSVFMVLHAYLGTTGATVGELFRLMWRGEPAAQAEPHAAATAARTRA